ncbi:unnamed protein product [Rotaria sordida]|uniref:SH3 domain-binding protein 5-like protein n=1 Tax=Rotaria sordida TaxID=392033 RepID=A0A814MR63_9BILA|nr:unnamed protein product [Rotaria sordida]
MANLPDTEKKTTVEPSVPSEDDDGVDPRVQIELERLNHANEAINHLELQLDEARKNLKEFCDTTEEELIQLEKNIGSAVNKARSYYEARIQLRHKKEALTKAKHRFERAQTLHVAAKELAVASADYIDEAEKSNQNPEKWSETYGHALAKAADAEREKYAADSDQQRAEQAYSEVEKSVEKLQKNYRRAINKSQPYYEKKAEYHKELDFQKRKVYGLENCVNEAKAQYQESLRNLEKISNEIHAQRNQGKLPLEPNERIDGAGEEQVTYTEFLIAAGILPYYEKKAEYHKELDFQKRKVYGLENCVNEAKAQYQESLRNLEKISNEIHAQRNQGKLPLEPNERIDGAGEEQNKLPSSMITSSPSSSPKIYSTKRLNRPEQLLRSCLLRTEVLPAGIFANTSGRTSPENDEITPTNFNDQFILSSQQPPQIVIINSDTESKNMFHHTHQRKISDDYSSQITDDEDDRTGSLHVLTDEQLEHLASVYHPLPPPPPSSSSSSETGTIKTSSTRMSESLLYSLSNPLSKLVLR